MSDAGKLTIEVALDAQNALNQFTADLLNGLQPKLADVRKSIDDALGGGSGGKRFGDLGDIAAGSFIGSFGSQLATKGLAIIQDFASKAVSVVESVLSKGWDRLVTIDTAKTKMQALKLSAADTQNAMDNALAAVKGTAFGMGDAATVAASAMASGVKPGEALVKYLKLVADSAAVARKQGQGMGEAFAQMGDLINRVTRKGYASMEEIGPLMSAELPIIENLSKRLNMTGAEVMDMASKTGIGASVIRAALEDTVGGAALKMGESFEGAMENAKTAVARLGEALLKPFFQPAKDGVTDFTSAINGLTETVTRNMPEIIQVVGDVAIAFVDMTAFALRSVGDLIDGIGQIIAPLGNIQGAMLKFQAWQAEIRGDDELAEQLRKDAEEAFGLGEGLQELGQRLKGVDADPLTNKIRKLTDDLSKGAKATNEFSQAQKTLQAAVDMGPQWAKLIYQSQVMQWVAQVREWTASGAKGSPPKMPTPPSQLGAATGPAGGPGYLPPDVIRDSKGSSGKSDAPPWLTPGGPIPTVEELMGELPQAGGDLTDSATALTGAADALTSAAAGGIGGIGGIPNLGAAPTNLFGAHAQIGLLGQIASPLGVILGTGATNHFIDNGFHPSGQAGDFNGTPQQMAAFAQTLMQNFAPFIRELIFQGPGISTNVYNGQLVPAIDMPGSPYNTAQAGYHGDHVHVAVLDEMAGALTAALAGGGGPFAGGFPSFPSFDTGYSPSLPGAWQAPDPKALREANQRITDLTIQLRLAEERLYAVKADATNAEKLSAVAAVKKAERELQDAKDDLKTLEQGKFAKGTSAGQFDFNMLPYGHPMRMAAGVLGGLGVSPQDIGAIIGQPISAVAGPIGNAVGSTAGSIFGVPLPGPMGYPGVPTAPSTDLNTLVQQQNPLALFQAAGFDVPDYSRFGGGPGAQNLTLQGGPASDAMGRIYSDTAALIDRTFTNLDAAEKARHDQVMTVLNEVRARLAKEYVEPVTEAAVTGGINGMSAGVTSEIGTAIGNTAGPIIASAIPSGGGGSSGIGAAAVNTAVQTTTNAVQGAFAGGGAVIGPGTGTSDSILARVSHGEWVMTANQVKAMGGFPGMQSFVNTLPRFATGGGVDVSKTVGAEFFGVGQVPVLAAIVNLLVAVLLKIIGVTIESRDTLDEISTDFREFRGDFQAFDAAGRLMNDTSGLLDRTGSSTQAAADERIRILKLVLEGLFKWLVEKIIVPISKAVANTAINIGAQAVNGAITGGMGAAFPGGSVVGGMVGGIASSAIQSAGQASVDIIAEVGTILAESLFSVALDASGDLLQSYFPNLVNSLFGGPLFAAIVDPITMTLNGVLSGITTLFGGLFGGLATVIPGLPFDEGGVATGMGLMPKATIRPERVLSPQQTASFERLVMALERNPRGALTTVHAPISVSGGERAGQQIKDRLLTLMS